MATPVQIQRELARRKIQGAMQSRAAPAPQQPRPAGIRGMISSAEQARALVESGGTLPGRPAGETLREVVPPAMEGLGAAGGAALGTMVAGAPGAIVGGGGGARMGRVLGQAITGQEVDPGYAGELGAAGPAAGLVFRHTARVFAKLPTVSAAVKHAQTAAERARRSLAGSQAERVIGRMADTFDRELASIAEAVGKARLGHRTGFAAVDAKVQAFQKGEISREALDHFLDYTEGKLGKYATRVPKAVADALTTAELAVERGAAAVPIPSPSYGTIPGALGALAGGAFGGMEGAVSGSAMGYLFGQLRGRAAYRLSNNPRFVNWASGLTPRSSLAQAGLAFVTDVLGQAESEQERADAEAFYELMLDTIERFPATALGIGGQAADASRLPQ